MPSYYGGDGSIQFKPGTPGATTPSSTGKDVVNSVKDTGKKVTSTVSDAAEKSEEAIQKAIEAF